jgi:DNA-binding transcriptional MerR regulator
MSGTIPAGRRVGKKPGGAAGVHVATAGVKAPANGIGSDDLFRDGKEAGALRTIGEVARALGLRQHVLRYWEDQFPTLRPLTRAGGRRYYRPEDIALLIDIDRLLHREGFTIRGALQALVRPVGRRPAATPVRDTSAPLLDVIDGVVPVDLTPVDPGAPEQALVSALAVLRQHLESIRSRLARELARA